MVFTADSSQEQQVDALATFVRHNKPLCVITGAGCSTDSGIFDYRDESGDWKREPPVHLDEFLRSDVARRKYWARSMLGWPRFFKATPNYAHRALVQLEQAGFVDVVITQNVDDLHEKSGQKNIIPLHGSLATVTCQDCGITVERQVIQQELESLNPKFVVASVIPDAGGEGKVRD